MGAPFRLIALDVKFYAAHGHIWDNDNREYTAKNFNDALVNLGITGDDRDVKASANQITKREAWVDCVNTGAGA